MKKVVLTRHAELKLQERGLRLDWVERTARNPLWVEIEPRDKSAERRFARIEEFGAARSAWSAWRRKTQSVL